MTTSRRLVAFVGAALALAACSKGGGATTTTTTSGGDGGTAPPADAGVVDAAPPLHTFATAFSFTSKLGLDKQLAKLSDATTWAWLRRDGEKHGAYLSAQAHPDGCLVRIYFEPKRDVFDIECVSQRPEVEAEYEAIRARVLGEILPSIAARDIHEIPPYGR